jgi:hypothetical protein
LLAAQDVRVTDRGLEPRSVLSQVADRVTSGSSYVVELLAGVEDYVVAVSGTTIYYTNDFSSVPWTWSDSSLGRPLPSPGMTSNVTTRYDWAKAYDPRAGKNTASLVFTCMDQMCPQILLMDGQSSHATYPDFHESNHSAAYAVSELDDRIVFFGSIDSNGTEFPTRVIFSARGNLSNLSVNGGGYEDLVDMRGTASRVFNDGQRGVLFTEQEIWQAIPRRDAYAFDFSPIIKSIGLKNNRTICETPKGLVFMGSDNRMYLLRGQEAIRIGRKVQPALEEGRITNSILQSLTYNPENEEVVLWSNPSAEFQAQIRYPALVLRLDTLQPNEFGELDGVWYHYTTVPSIWLGTTYFDYSNTAVAPAKQLLANGDYGSGATVRGSCFYSWDSTMTVEQRGSFTSVDKVDAITDTTVGVALAAPLQGDRDYLVTERPTAAWVVAQNAANNAEIKLGYSTVDALARYDNMVSPTVTFSTFTLEGASSNETTMSQAASGVYYTPIHGVEAQQRVVPTIVFSNLSNNVARPIISRLDFELRSYTGKFIPGDS